VISVYDVGNTAYTANGNAVLHPVSCVMSEDAGGSYEVAMVHPIAADGIWEHLVNEAIIKVPVPVPVIQSAYVGQDVDVYKINSNNTALREEPNEPTRITYQTWQDTPDGYSVGSKVTYSQNGHNYQCVHGEGGSSVTHNPPTHSDWARIADYTSGSPALITLAADTEVYYIEASGQSWAKVSTKQGIVGYVKNSQITFVRHETVQPVPERVVEDQLFRIYNVVINTDNQTVNVNARHVSYDLSGVLLGPCNLALQEPSWAIMRIQDAMLIPYQGEIATNMTGTDNGTYTGDLSNKNGTQAILDPDKGIIPYFRGKLIRDNWDMFLMKNDLVDRGIRLVYGTNLRGVSWKRNTDKKVNRVRPVAKAADGSDLYLPEQWIDSDGGTSPVIRMERLKVDGQVGKDDGTGTETTWTEENLLDHMREKAAERFTVDHADAQVVELTVNFTLLGETEEYKEYRGLEKVYMYDLVRVVDPRVGMNIQLQVSHVEWDCIMERYISIKVGNVYDYGGRTVFGYNIGSDAIEYEKISTETIRRIISEAG
jgi:phage minor structural protein